MSCCGVQVYNTSEVGGSLVMQYHLEQLPAVFIVDPITGAKLWEKSGFVSPDTFIEELVPFLDVGEYSRGLQSSTTGTDRVLLCTAVLHWLCLEHAQQAGLHGYSTCYGCPVLASGTACAQAYSWVCLAAPQVQTTLRPTSWLSASTPRPPSAATSHQAPVLLRCLTT